MWGFSEGRQKKRVKKEKPYLLEEYKKKVEDI